MTDQLFTMWSPLGQEMTDYLTLSTIPQVVWGGMDKSFVYE